MRTGFKGKDWKALGLLDAHLFLLPLTRRSQSKAAHLDRLGRQLQMGDVQWSPAQEAVAAEAREPSLQSRVELPEISIPAFFLDATGPPMNASRSAAPAVRVPCPTCGC